MYICIYNAYMPYVVMIQPLAIYLYMYMQMSIYVCV